MGANTTEMTIREAEALQGSLGGEAPKWEIGHKLRLIRVDANRRPYLAVGNSTTGETLTTYAEHGLEVYTTCPSTDGSNSVDAIYMKSIMTGAAGVGGRARFHMYTNVALGGWSNAVKAHVEYGASGRTAGLGSALCAEVELSAGTSSGTYCALEAELVLAANAVTGTKTSFIYCNATGAAASTFDTNGVFLHIGDGITAAATKFASATYQTLKCYFTDGDTTRYLFLSQIEDGISLGNSTTAQTHTAGTPLFQVYSTCSSGASEPFYVKSVMTGTAGTGGRARFHLYTNEAQGGWANALKAFTEFGAAGRITGLASCFCADLELSIGTTSGTYTVNEMNIIADAAVSTGTLTSFLRCNIAGTDGTGVTTINTNAYLFDLGEGIVDTASGMIDSATITATDFSHRIRIRALGVDMWIGAHTDPDFTT